MNLMMMNRRKQSDVCSDSSGTSMVYNPETVFDLNAESSSGSARKIPRFNLNLNSSTEFAPFNDFFMSKDDSTGICLDLKLSLSPPLSVSPPCAADTNTNPVLSKTVLSDDATPAPVCCESGTYSTDSETDSKTVLDVMPLSMYIPDDVNAAAAVGTVPVAEEVQWTVRKVLTKSDCNDQHRLLISKNLAEPHILNYLDKSRRKQVDSSGLMLEVFDCDTKSWVDQTLRRWPSSGCIALMDNWKRDFVVRRGLKVGDEVGLCYQDNILSFSVLRRASLIEN